MSEDVSMRTRSHARFVPLRPSRYQLRIPCQVIRARDFKLIADQTMDVSEHGMLVLPRLRVLTGEEVIVSFMAPFTRRYVDAEGVIARVEHGRRTGDLGRGLGIELGAMDHADRALLRSQLSFLPVTMPRRRMWS
jgi:hypothetical protein